MKRLILAALLAAPMLVACDTQNTDGNRYTDPILNERAPCGPGTQVDCQ